jgi:hypothetical protein
VFILNPSFVWAFPFNHSFVHSHSIATLPISDQSQLSSLTFTHFHSVIGSSLINHWDVHSLSISDSFMRDQSLRCGCAINHGFDIRNQSINQSLIRPFKHPGFPGVESPEFRVGLLPAKRKPRDQASDAQQNQ